MAHCTAVVDACSAGHLDRFVVDADGLGVAAETCQAPASVVQHGGQAPAAAETPEQRDRLVRVLLRCARPRRRVWSGSPSARTRPPPLAPVVAERGELPVSFGEERRRVVPGVRADAFDREQQPGERGPGPVADGLEDLQAVQGGGGALLAGVHDAGPGPLHQRYGLHGAGAGGLGSAG